MDTINERIARCIAITGLTRTAFAKRINLSQPHISKIALGESAPSDRTIADICREFNVSEAWLRTGEGEMFATTPETLAEKLSKEYGLDDLGCQIMAAYLRLDEQDRLAVGRLIQNIIDERVVPAFAPTHIPTIEEEARAEAEEYYRQLLAEKNGRKNHKFYQTVPAATPPKWHKISPARRETSPGKRKEHSI